MIKMQLKNPFKKKPKEYSYFKAKEISEDPQKGYPYGEKPKTGILLDNIIKACKKKGKYKCVAIGYELKKELNKEGLLD